MLSPHFKPFTREFEVIDIGSGAELLLAIKGSPEQVARLKRLILDTARLEVKRMRVGMPDQYEVKRKMGGCGCKENGAPLDPS